VAGLALVLLAACGSGSGNSQAATRLEVDATTGSATVLRPSEATLECDGTATATGFLRDRAGPACAAVRDKAIERVAAAQVSGRPCSQVYGGPQHARIKGTIDRRRVDLTVNRTDSCGTADWQTLEPLLGDPEGRRVNTPATTAAPSTTAAPTTYTVKRGDTLSSIAKQFHVPVAAIVFVNRIPDPDHLAEGVSLVIPPVPPAQVMITPPAAVAGTSFKFELTGAKPSESVTFEIDSPSGKYTGPPHTASADGVVTASYQTAFTDAPGDYEVVAKGNQETAAQASFRVDSPSTETTASSTAP
jgi:LysM repeat protein